MTIIQLVLLVKVNGHDDIMAPRCFCSEYGKEMGVASRTRPQFLRPRSRHARLLAFFWFFNMAWLEYAGLNLIFVKILRCFSK